MNKVAAVAVVAIALVASAAVALAAPAGYRSSIKPLTSAQKSMLKKAGVWRKGCPVGLEDLRVLTVTRRGFDQRTYTGQLVVNKSVAGKLAKVFRKLYQLHFPIRHLSLESVYVRGKYPKDGDTSGSFECRQAVPSPCTGGSGTGSWSNHAYGLAVDINPAENPYVGCGQSRDPKARSYRDRSRHRPGMITARARAAFESVGWAWGGSWAGNTKDYMHFSVNGR